MFNKEDVQKYLYFDVETACSYSSLSELKSSDERLYHLWKKRELYYKGAYEELKTASEEDTYLAKAGLEPEFSRIVCVSFGSFTESGEKRFASFYGDDEIDILNKSFKVLSNAAAKNWKLCGHNIKGFDVPCLGKRMIYNGIPLPSNLNIWNKKPWDLPYMDTSEIFAFGSWIQQKYLSLDLLSCSLGIQSPKESMDGSLVTSYYWDKKDYAGIKEYCEADVDTVMSIMSKMCFSS